MKFHGTGCKVSVEIGNSSCCVASYKLSVVQGLVLSTLSLRYPHGEKSHRFKSGNKATQNLHHEHEEICSRKHCFLKKSNSTGCMRPCSILLEPGLIDMNTVTYQTLDKVILQNVNVNQRTDCIFSKHRSADQVGYPSF